MFGRGPLRNLPTLAWPLISIAAGMIFACGAEPAPPAPTPKTQVAQDRKPPAPPPPKFVAGQRIPNGILKTDVLDYNAAQGDPTAGAFSLQDALAGNAALAGEGQLVARFTTSSGNFDCTLLETEAPATVANFVGLARGTRPFRDHKSEKWVKRPYYNGTTFHRVIRGFMIQGGDPTGSGSGSPGYVIPDEVHPKLRHHKAGILSMANLNRFIEGTNDPIIDPKSGKPLGNTGSGQFFITVGPAPHLDQRHTIFGQCQARIPLEISKARVKSLPGTQIQNRPVKPIIIESIEIVRRASSASGKKRRRRAKSTTNK